MNGTILSEFLVGRLMCICLGSLFISWGKEDYGLVYVCVSTCLVPSRIDSINSIYFLIVWEPCFSKNTSNLESHVPNEKEAFSSFRDIENRARTK